MNNKGPFIKGWYFLELSSSDGNNLIKEVLNDNVVDETKENGYIGLWGFDFDLFEKDKEGVLR